MSAPDTNLKRQARNHKPVLVGLAVAAIIAFAAAFAFLIWTPVEEDQAISAPLSTPGTD